MKLTDKQLARYLFHGTHEKKGNEKEDQFISLFLNYLIKTKKKSRLNNIMRLYQNILETNSNLFEVILFRKEKIAPQTLSAIESMLRKKLGPQAVFKIIEKQDPNIIGGIKLFVRDQLLDITINKRIQDFQKSLLK